MVRGCLPLKSSLTFLLYTLFYAHSMFLLHVLASHSLMIFIPLCLEIGTFSKQI